MKEILYNMNTQPYIVGINATEEKIRSDYDPLMPRPTVKRQRLENSEVADMEVDKENIVRKPYVRKGKKFVFKKPYTPNIAGTPFNKPKPFKLSEPMYKQWTPNTLTPKTRYYDKKNEEMLQTAHKNMLDSSKRQSRHWIKDNRVRTPSTSLDRDVRAERLKGTRNIIINWDGREYKIGPENEVKKTQSMQRVPSIGDVRYSTQGKQGYYQNKDGSPKKGN
jgi:hypothetical protein